MFSIWCYRIEFEQFLYIIIHKFDVECALHRNKISCLSPVKFFVSYSDFDYFFCIFVSLFVQIHQLTDLVMIISYPASLNRIIVSSKPYDTSWLWIWRKKVKERNAAIKKAEKIKGMEILSIKCNKQRGRENLSIRPGQEFWVYLEPF